MNVFMCLLKRIFFYFLFLYCLEVILFYYNVPLMSSIQDSYYSFLKLLINKLYLFLGGNEHLVSELNGSTDRLFDYIKNGLFLFLSIPISLFSYKFYKVRKILDYLPTIIQITSILVLFEYGFAKIYNLQFMSPDYFRLSEEIGNMSPMRLLWTFMGVSYSFKVFVGISQVIAATLLIFKRTMFLGSLMSSILFLNIFIFNMTFDGPLKSFSFIFLISNLLILLRTEEAAFVLKRILSNRKLEKKEVILSFVVLLPLVMMNYRGFDNISVTKDSLSFSGEYRAVSSLNHNVNFSFPRMIIERYGKVKFFSSQYKAIDLDYSGDEGHFVIFDNDKEMPTKLILNRGDESGQVSVRGILNGIDFNGEYKLIDKEKLIFRPFRFINDYPFNESESFKRRKFY